MSRRTTLCRPLQRKAILLTNRDDNSEMEELIFALGANLVGVVLQRRLHPDPQLFLGSGKTEEARELLRASGADLVVIGGNLKPIQIFNHQRFFDEGRIQRGKDAAPQVEVYDRTRLILEIFRERARSPEARLQVELATLQYEMPLVKEAIHAQRRGERQAAQFGGGEYEVNQYHDMMKKRMSRIRRDLEKMSHERGVRRKHRRRGGFHLVSLAGYTNAGKSSLLRAMSQQDALVENRYFSTLATKTARVHSDRREILVTDTVGFIEDLPPWMVDAFHSTLEEIALADVILLVLDASDSAEEMSRRLRSSLRILWQFDGRHASATGANADVRGGPSAPPMAYAASRRRGGDTTVDEESEPSAAPQQVDAQHAQSTDARRDETPMHPARGGQAPQGRHAEDAPNDANGEESVEYYADAANAAAANAAVEPRVLMPMRRGLAPILVALNKTDRVPPEEMAAKRARLEAQGLLDPEATVAVSAHTGDGLQDLYERLYALIPDYDEYEVALPPSPESEAFIAWLHDNADVLDLTRGNEAHVHFEAKRSLRPTLAARLNDVGATPLREAMRESRQTAADEAAADEAQGVDATTAKDAREASDTREESGTTGTREVNETGRREPPKARE